MAPTTYQRPDDIDLGSLWRAGVRSLPRLIVISMTLAAGTYVVLGMMAPRFVSETQLAIESNGTTSPFTDPSRGGASDNVTVRMDKEAINTHVRALMSTDLGEEIVREMKLADLPEFNSAKGSPDKWSALLRLVGIGAPRASESDQDRALDTYFKRLEVYSPKESRFIGIRFTSIDPELAAAVANRIAETYRVNLAHQSVIETDAVQKALEPKIAKLAEEAAAAEEGVEKFRGEANIFKGGQQATGLNEQQLAELNAELSKVKAARSEAEARAKQAREMEGLGSAETLSDVQKSPLIQNLVQSRVRVERQISELSATLLPGHPRMRQLSADLKGLKSQIDAEVGKIVDGLGKEAKVAALREDALQRSVNDIKSRIVNSGPEEAKLRSLEADAKSKRAELDRLRAQYESNRVRADDSRTIPVEAQIVSSARPSSVPVFPRKTSTALLVALASMMIGLALVITRGLLMDARVPAARGERASRRKETSHRASREERATPELRLPESLAPEPAPAPMPPAFERNEAFPPPGNGPLLAPLIVEDEPEPETGTEVEPETEVELPPPSSEPATALVEPPAPRDAASLLEIATAKAMAERVDQLRKDGKSGTRSLLTGASDVFTLAHEAARVCRELAARERAVIMVDWSLNGAGIAEPLGLPSWPGFTELGDGKARFEDVVRSLRDSDVHLIPCGHALPGSAETLDGESINFLLDALDDVYDHIVVVARAEPARRLFEAIQGRFDCAITLVSNLAEKAEARSKGGGSFLGFDVEGIALFTLDQAEPAGRHQKLARAG
ncbi:MAG: lipopolysaccharide biosynthesis protein [Hyphomicrobium sp.]|uniref:GumC family protein n=1 Tax=Hyphomicrobium sp. TaxID=82 RepID=UPI003D0D3CCA